MCSIEKITSKTKVVKIADSEQKDGTREVEVKVWNDTVANLSLLAFGTSAPEILTFVLLVIFSMEHIKVSATMAIPTKNHSMATR
jgi:solute carrier family 8 (sodium/calcium exchanger)